MATTELSRQQQKSQDMKRRVRSAAIASLAELGYDRTSIKRVVERADVSQGALLHHFPTKTDLMAAVAEHLFGRAVRWARMMAGAGDAGLQSLTMRSWKEQFRTDEYAALLEILTAARTHKDLHARIAGTLRDWHDVNEAELVRLFREAGADDSRISSIVAISRCLMSGLLVHDALVRDEREVEKVLQDWDAIRETYLRAVRCEHKLSSS
ncbi:MAG: helix-turn-helix domain-containing protein [Pseudomonadota bacterium]